MSKRYLISTAKSVNRKAVESVLHDEMTETIYPVPLESDVLPGRKTVSGTGTAGALPDGGR